MLTVWEHLQFTARIYHVTDQQRDERAEWLLDVFDLQEKRHTVAQELSRGMRQKVAISCAFLHQLQVIVFDEPLTGLDPRAIRTLKDQIVRRASEGAAILISSHLLSLAEEPAVVRQFGGVGGIARSGRVDVDGANHLRRDAGGHVPRTPSVGSVVCDLFAAGQHGDLRNREPRLPAVSAPSGDSGES